MERFNKEEKYSIFTIHMNHLLHHYAVKGIVSKASLHKNCLSFLIEPESEAELLSIDPLKIVDHKQEELKNKQKREERKEVVTAPTELNPLTEDIKDDKDKQDQG